MTTSPKLGLAERLDGPAADPPHDRAEQKTGRPRRVLVPEPRPLLARILNRLTARVNARAGRYHGDAGAARRAAS